ncbi:hypothetical protein D5086_011348 [Populus alba]|uniref:Uncharacterized protein n=1 Tax=Populus alba TaxID=43335 RepID=A0ACC4CC91_POPAL
MDQTVLRLKGDYDSWACFGSEQAVDMIRSFVELNEQKNLLSCLWSTLLDYDLMWIIAHVDNSPNNMPLGFEMIGEEEDRWTTTYGDAEGACSDDRFLSDQVCNLGFISKVIRL